MAYCTYTSIITINPLLPATGATGFTTTMVTMIQAHEVRAGGIIDMYCARRFDLPFSPVPPAIRAIAEDITSYFVFRSYFTMDNANKSEYFEQYARAVTDLEKIQKGEVDLVNTDGSLVTVNSADEQSLLDSTSLEYNSFFNVDDELDWKFDDDLKISITDERK